MRSMNVVQETFISLLVVVEPGLVVVEQLLLPRWPSLSKHKRPQHHHKPPQHETEIYCQTKLIDIGVMLCLGVFVNVPLALPT